MASRTSRLDGKPIQLSVGLDISEQQFSAIRAGDLVIGRLNQDWAAYRVIEYAPYRDIMQMIGLKRLLSNWPRWRTRIRSLSRRRGLDFLVKWLPEKHPEYFRVD